MGELSGAVRSGASVRIVGRSARHSYLLLVTFIAGAYVTAAEAGFALAFATEQVTAIWPPTGIAVAALLCGGARLWPGVFIGAFLSNAFRNEPLYTAAGIAVGNTLGPLFGAYLLRRVVRIDPRFSRLRDVFGLAILGAAGAMTITASNGVLNLSLGGLIQWSATPSVWCVWWIGDAMGVLLVAPVILTWYADSRIRHRRARWFELLGLAVILVATSSICFSTKFPLGYPIFPVVIWAALRFRQRETATAVLIASAIAIWPTAHERGPFVSGSLDRRLVLLVTFMAVLSMATLLLGALVAARRRAEDALREANARLEQRVSQRTSELAAANDQLAATNAALERSTRELARKNEEVESFVFIVSHDLRAPLVNIQGFSRELELSCEDLQQALDELPLNAEAALSLRGTIENGIGGALRYIGASVSKIERLIEALLLLSRTGQQTYRLEQLDIRWLVESTVESSRQAIQAAGAEVAIGPLPMAVGDMTAIGQVFSNLLDNAIKYLKPGCPGRIEIAGADGPAGPRYWVRDNGIGIAASAHARLFQIFQRFHPQMADGEGIGLAAVKRIVERHGGQIWVESEPGSGSTFHFTLPAPITEEAKADV